MSMGRHGTGVVPNLPCPEHRISVSCPRLYVTLIVSANVLSATVYRNETCHMRPERTYLRTFAKWIKSDLFTS